MNKTTLKVTNGAIIAALIIVGRLIVKYIFTRGTPLGNLGAAKELQYYIIPIATLYVVSKFGQKDGFWIAFNATFVAAILTAILGLWNTYKWPWGMLFDYLLPWLLCTLVAFVPKKSFWLLVILPVIWQGVMLMWAVSSVLVWGYTFKAGYYWLLTIFQGWTMFILLPLVVFLIDIVFLKKYKQ